VSRQAIFHAAQEHAPSLPPFLSWAYGGRSWVSSAGNHVNSAAVLSTSGVKQGDALEPLLFALMRQGPLRRTATAHPETEVVAFFSGISIVSQATASAPAFEALAMQVRSVGLTPEPCTSAAHSPDMDMSVAMAAADGVLHAKDSLGVAGTPIGADQFVNKFLAHKRQEVHDEPQRTADLLHPIR
jgi:hypothetical protein